MSLSTAETKSAMSQVPPAAATLWSQKLFVALTSGLVGLIVLSCFASGVWQLNQPGFEGKSLSVDFAAFWGAAKMVLSGLPSEAYDYDLMRQVQQLGSDEHGRGWLPWLYPPPVLAMVTPFGLLPFSVAWISFSLLCYAAFAAALCQFVTPSAPLRMMVLVAPAVMMTLVLGQVSTLWCAGVLCLLAALRDGKPALAGLMLALIAMKPQLALLVPVALLAAGHWRVLLWGAFWLAALILASLPTAGIESWYAFVESATSTWDIVNSEEGVTTRDISTLMVSWHPLLTWLGLGETPATVIQTCVTLSFAAGIFWIWRRTEGNRDLAIAALLFAAPIATPYALHYELVVSATGCFFLIRGSETMGRAVVWGLFLVWMVPLLWAGPIHALDLTYDLSFSLLTAPLLSLLFIACLRQVRSQELGKPKPA